MCMLSKIEIFVYAFSNRKPSYLLIPSYGTVKATETWAAKVNIHQPASAAFLHDFCPLSDPLECTENLDMDLSKVRYDQHESKRIEVIQLQAS